MSLLNSLLDAIIRLGGNSLVMHVGERPYVVTTSSSVDQFRGPLSWGQVELSSRPLTPEAVVAMLGQMLPADVRATLDELGAVEHEIDSPDGQHRFVVVAARGGDDVWVEVRVKQDPPPPELLAAAEARQAELQRTVETREAELRSELARRDAELASEAERREAAARAELLATGDERVARIRAELEREAEDREAAARAEMQALSDARDRALRAELAARDAERQAAAEAREAAIRAAIDDAREAQVAEARAALEAQHGAARAALEAREAELRADSTAALQALEARLTASMQARESELLATFEARDAAARAEAAAEAEARDREFRSALDARTAEIQARAGMAVEAREAELRAALDAREAELRAQAHAAEAREAELRALAQTAEARAADLRAALERREAETRAETAAVLAARESEFTNQLTAAIAQREAGFAEQLATTLARREAEFGEQLAATLALREAEFGEQLSAALIRRDLELTADATTVASRHEEELAGAFAAERTRLEGELAGRAAEIASLTEHTTQMQAVFAARLEEAEARAAERESALNAAFEARLADAIAKADERVQAIEQSITHEAQARAAAEAAALGALEAGALHAEIERGARQAQAEIEGEYQAAPAPPLHAPAAPPLEAAPVGGASSDEPAEDSRPFLVLPRYPASAHSSTGVLLDVLRDGLERGASAVYAIGGSRPLLRIEGEITSPSSLPILHAADIDRFAFEFAPRDEVAHSTSEWTTMVPDVGRVRSVSFEDAAGRGLVFHLAANISTADELGLSREIQALCNEPDGLIVLAGPRASGKSTLLSAFVDRINRSRSDHVITIESRVRTLHERRHSLISQREVDGEGVAIARAARAALREGPDVLVMDDARSPEAIVVAVDAARAGRLVLLSMPAPRTTAAIERLTDAFSVDRRPQVRALLSGALRAVISQVLVNRIAGGRIAAREVLLSSPQVKQLILDGVFAQVPVAIEGGRRLGMVTLTDSLVGLVRDRSVSPAEALRHAPNRRVMIAALRQEGIDVSEFERRA